MAEIFTIFIFIGVIMVTALIFGVWLIAMLVRMVFKGVGAILFPSRDLPAPVVTRGAVCGNLQCRAVNPDSAHFCRRCGTQLPQAQRVNVRRAAMW